MADVHDAALILGVDPQTVRRLVADGRLTVKDRVGKALLFYRVDVERLVDEVSGQPERPDLCPICRRPVGDDAYVWDATTPGRPIPPPGDRDDELHELIVFPVRFCPAHSDFEARVQAVLAERRTHPEDS